MCPLVYAYAIISEDRQGISRMTEMRALKGVDLDSPRFGDFDKEIKGAYHSKVGNDIIRIAGDVLEPANFELEHKFE